MPRRGKWSLKDAGLAGRARYRPVFAWSGSWGCSHGTPLWPRTKRDASKEDGLGPTPRMRPMPGETVVGDPARNTSVSPRSDGNKRFPRSGGSHDLAVVQFADHPMQPLDRQVEPQKRELVQLLTSHVLQDGPVQGNEPLVETRVAGVEVVQRG